MRVPWIVEELKTTDLKDERLNARLREVLSQLAVRPTASIPAACGGRAEMEAAYRLFDNDKVTFENILESHCCVTSERIAAQDVVILAQDTTEVDLTRPEQQVRGAGPLNEGTRWGALLHLLHAFTPDGTPLGTVQAFPFSKSKNPSTTGPRKTVTASSAKKRAHFSKARSQKANTGQPTTSPSKTTNTASAPAG